MADAEALQTPEAIALRARVALALGDVDEAGRLMREQGSAIAEPERTILQAGVQLAAGAGARSPCAAARATARQPG